jgi:pimeloyl-ACP methyl ester carboxylesterase
LTEPGVTVPGLLFTPSQPRGPLVILLNGAGKSADIGPDGAVEKLVRGGKRVLALDPRGLGETAPGTAKAPSHFGVDFTDTFLALHLNRPLLGQRVRDVLAVIETMVGQSPEGVTLVGIGKAGPIALHAAALDRRIKDLVLQGSLASWTSVVQTPISYDQLTNVVPGALAVYDLPELAATLAPRPLTVYKPVDPTGQVLDKDALEQMYAPVREVYRRSKAEQGLVLLVDEGK